MNILINLPFEFLRKIVLVSFWYDKILFLWFMIIPIINKNMIVQIYIYDLWFFLYK